MHEMIPHDHVDPSEKQGYGQDERHKRQEDRPSQLEQLSGTWDQTLRNHAAVGSFSDASYLPLAIHVLDY